MIVFAQALRTAYRRVNKTASFNTRCFPSCSATGHSDCSFCGRPFVIVSKAPAPAYFAEFAVQTSACKQSAVQFSAEGHVGVILTHGIVVFNPTCQAWKYAWKSSRHTYETRHVMRIYAFDPETAAVLFCGDSTPFTVSSTRRVDDDEPESDLLAVLAAMNRLVPSSLAMAAPSTFDAPVAAVPDDAHMAFAEEDDASTVSSLSLSEHEEAHFLAHEQLRGTLERLYAFMVPQYATWQCAADMRADVEMFLCHSESTTIANVAALAADLLTDVTPHTNAKATLAVVAAASFTHAEALALAHSFLYEGERFVDGVDLGGANDPSGLYERNEAFTAMLCQLKSSVGWSPLDVDLLERARTMCVAALTPSHFFVGFIGPNGPSDVLMLGAANQPADMRPTMFGAAMFTRVTYVFATNLGIMQIARGIDGGDLYLGKSMPTAAGQLTTHVQLRAANKCVLRDERFVFRRIALDQVVAQ